MTGVRLGNIVLVAVCGAAVVAAGVMAWRGRRLPVVAPADRVIATPRDAALDAVRTLACVMSAGLVAGVLVVGLGGRLVMRALAATSGSAAQGKLTEAGEVVGEITLGGSLGFLLFVGILLPLAAAFGYLLLRRLAPGPAWLTGLVFGTILLGTVGIDDPLARDNVDFVILRPVWVAVVLVAATALLFGMTFAAVAARLDAALVGPGQLRRAGWRQRLAYGSLLWLLNPVFGAAALVYVGCRAVSHGRLAAVVEAPRIRVAGTALVALATVGTATTAIAAAADLL